MRACFLIATLAVVACLPAYAEPPSAPVAADTPRVEAEPQPSALHTILSTVIGAREQGTVADREQDDEVWREDSAAADEAEAAPTCKNCPLVQPARRVNLPAPTVTAPRN